ncbi:HpcH/HpaI aldolase/citrate lyase family protein [Pseudoroseicyclus sp. CXY001]|uniref:HpcH/HpaI aldolase family protein n=1 Tax=Pseudoroseicyclus sp. CXY001 TaxID=3242492 RepID=UPI00358DD863
MLPDPDVINDFRARLQGGASLMGTFLKLPGPHVIEVLGGVGLDFAILDEEHAPWTRETLDVGILAARASGVASIVRVARAEAASILSALDCGATGVMVPHVDSVAKAEVVASAGRYIGGTRGAGAARGGFYGRRGPRNYEMADEEATVIAMIEDAAAIDDIDAIAAVEGIHALFIGRGDLGLSLRNARGSADDLNASVERVAEAARRHGKGVMAVVPAPEHADTAWLRGLGVTTLAVSSDIGFLQSAARAARQAF